MDAEVFFVFEIFGEGLRDTADAALDSGAVLDETGDVLTYVAKRFVGLWDGNLEDVLVKGDEAIDGVDVEEGVAKGAGHTGVDLGDDEFGVGGGGLDNIDGDAEGAQAVDVGRSDGNKGDVERDSAAFKFAGDFGKEDGGVVADTLAERVANVVGNEK